MTVEFNPRDHVVLTGGLMNGQVCYWDLRTGENPINTSHQYVSHRYDTVRSMKTNCASVLEKLMEQIS